MCSSLARLTCINALLLRIVFAQTDTGSLAGSVTDPTRAGVPKASVTLKNKATSAMRNANTGSDGRYQFNLLTPGVYEITVDSSGLKRFTGDNVHVQVAQPATLNIQLELGTSAESVQVVSSVSLLNTES